MSEPYLGSIMLFAGNFAPRNYALCDGQLLSISQNTALFSILGTTYGGNGTSTFALPDLRGRVPVGAGSGPGLNPVVEGQMGGTQTVSISVSNLPQHTHTVNPAVSNATGTSSNPAANFPAVGTATVNGGARGEQVTPLVYGTSSNATGGAFSTGVAGSNIPLSIEQPFTAINYCIALTGIFPTRN